MIRFEQVSKAYLGGRQALQGVTFHLQPGEMAFLTGHSGAGKSTLLKLICGIERPSAGKIFFSGHEISRLKSREVPFLRRQIGMIFQDHHLLMDRTVYDNVAIPLIIAGASGDDIRRRVSAALDKVGLLDKAKNFPIQLSGGEQQRVGIARAVVNKPAVLLADEPTGNLDEALSEGILRLFEEFNRVGVTVLMATHDLGLISSRPYRVLTLSDGHLHGGIRVNKRDAMNQIRQFGSKFDRLRNAAGGGGGGRNAPKRPKAAPNPASRKSNVFNEQVRYAWHGALQDLKSTPLATFLTVMVIAISLTLPSVCYMVYKNVSSAASQYYPSPQITVYLEKTLDDDAAARVVGQLQAEQGVDKVNYLSRDEALGEFRNWSGFGGALDMLEENPLPAVAIVVPKLDFQSTEALNTLRDRVSRIQGVDEVRMDDSWFARLSSLTGLVGRVSAMIGVLMVAAVFLVIGNSVRLSIFARRDTINVQKLIGATDGFILRPFLYGGAMLGFSGAFLSLILSEILVMRLSSAVTEVAKVFGTQFELSGLGFDECLLMLIVCSMIGWVAAWLATVQHLRHFTPD